MYIINRLPVAGIATAIRVLCLTALIVLSFVAAYTVTPFIVAAIAAVLATVVQVVAAILAIVAHAALFALACAVRGAVLVALCRALPVAVRVLWRLAVAVYRHRDGLLIAAKGLALAAVVVGVFVGAIVVMPLVLAAAGKALVVAAVVGGAVLSGKVM